MSRSLRVDRSHIEKVKLAVSRSGFPSQRSLAEAVGMALATVNNFLNGKPVDRAIFVELCDKLSLDYQAIAAIEWASVTEEPPNQSPSPFSQSSKLCDWGEAIEISLFYGRQSELTTLERAISQEGCQLLCLLGMGGMGKTAMAVKLAQQIQGEFKYLIWRSLRNAPPPEELLTDLIQFLSEQQEINPSNNLERKIARLIDYLSQHRCLIVLDNLESVLHSGTHAGCYRKGYEGYGDLLRAVGTARHRSCLLLTSREKPREVALLEDTSQTVQTQTQPRRTCVSLFLKGLTPQQGKPIFTTKGCFAMNEQEWNTVFTHYAGNPLALQIVAAAVEELFEGHLTEILPYLQQGMLHFDDIQELLERQFERLSDLEQQVMYWLAVNRDGFSLLELQEDLISSDVKRYLISTVQSLHRRNLLERTEKGLLLQPVVMEYVTNRLIRSVCGEIVAEQPNLLRTHALIKAQSQNYIRQAQVRCILHPVMDRLLAALGSTQSIKHQIEQILTTLRKTAPRQPGYVGGNLFNLLGELTGDLNEIDGSYLTIRQAYLQDINLRSANLSHANLEKCLFTETFGSIHSVAFSPDGQRLMGGDTNGDIRLWDARTHQLLLTCKGHTNWVQSITCSPDSQILASGSFDQTVRLWDVNTGKCLKTLSGHTNAIYSIAFSPDGKVLASGSDDYTVRLWDVNTGECLKSLKSEEGIKPYAVRSVAFSRDGKNLVSSYSESTIRLWNIKNGQCWKTLLGHQGWVWSVAFSPDGQVLASGGDDTTLKLWDVDTGECLKTLAGHTNGLRSVAFSQDGRRLISGSTDRTVKLWDIQTGQCLRTLAGHGNWVWSVAFNTIPPTPLTKGSHLLAGVPPVVQSGVGEGGIVASGSEDRTVRLWSLDNGQCLKAFQGYANTVFSIAFVQNPVGCHHSIASGYFDKVVRLWNTKDGQCTSFRGHTDAIRAVALSPDGQILASGGSSADQTVKLWSLKDGQCQRTLSGHTNEIWSVAFSRDGQILASSSTDRTIRLWSTLTGQCLKILEGHTHWVMSVAFSSQTQILASASFDRTIRFWDWHTGECLQTLQGHQLAVCSIAFSPVGPILASGSVDHTVRLWDIDTGKCLKVLPDHTAIVWSVALSQDGKLVASGSFDQTVRLWDVRTGECLKVLQGHTNGIWSVAFVPQHGVNPSGSQFLSSAGDDETIRLWDVETGECVRTFRPPKPYEGMNILGAKGLTDAQKETLKALGAVESEC